MEQFKIDNFQRANPDAVFPPFRALDVSECGRIRADLARRCGLPESSDALQVLRELDGHPALVDVPGSDTAGPDVRGVLKRGGIRPTLNVYLNWHRLDEIDEMSLDDLTQNFDDIWYPSSDDLEIFDESFSWFLFVRHHGAVKLVLL